MKKNITNKESSITNLMNILDSVSPIGGGRPKMLVLYNEADNTIKLNTQKLQKGYKRAIIKFDEVYYENESIGLTKLEYIFMQMAKEAGINTANFKLVEEKENVELLYFKKLLKFKKAKVIHSTLSF